MTAVPHLSCALGIRWLLPFNTVIGAADLGIAWTTYPGGLLSIPLDVQVKKPALRKSSCILLIAMHELLPSYVG
ncbi:hypothetical protein BC629DRAFT_313930 [Irpex lacteus]|nr:hypothetical protein BC629DRAFT_313930 [Irpex lacteus]